MKIRHVWNEITGAMEEVTTLEEGDAQSWSDVLEKHGLDHCVDEPPQTMAQRKAMVAGYEESEQRELETIFRDYLLHGKEALINTRAQTTGTTAGGGPLVPTVFTSELDRSEQQADEINVIATVLETVNGSAFDYPITDSAGATASVVAENGQTSQSTPLAFDRVAFGRTPTVRADDIISSIELASDSQFSLTSVVAREGGQRLGRYGGTAGIAAIIADADAGVTAAATGAITADEILDLVASVDEQYAVNGAFLMSTGTMIALRKLKASTGGSFLLPFGKDSTGRKTLFDFPIYISPSMETIAAGNRPVAFGQLNRVIKRVVRGSLTVQTLTEKYALNGQVGWCVRVRMDFKLAKSAGGPLPIRLLQMHA